MITLSGTLAIKTVCSLQSMSSASKSLCGNRLHPNPTRQREPLLALQVSVAESRTVIRIPPTVKLCRVCGPRLRFSLTHLHRGGQGLLEKRPKIGMFKAPREGVEGCGSPALMA